jgi:nucleoside-diphosphate-sugar epimerase
VAGKTLIIGAGYIGLPLAMMLQTRGSEVHVWVRSAASAEGLRNFGFARVCTGNVADESAWESVRGSYDVVIHGASSGRGGEAAYAEVFLNGMRQVAKQQPEARKIFVSSTSVYGQTSGEIVTEESPAEPFTATGKILREAENVALAARATVVRSSGIYGPTRAVLWEKFKRGEAVVEGDGSRWINQINQLDLVLALAWLAENGQAGEIYNVTDDTPVMQRDYYAWCAEFLKRPLPPSGAPDPNRKRGLTNKRVSNAKLRATGWAPIYPSFADWFRVAPDVYSPK